MRIVLLLCATFVLKVATEPIRAKLGVQPNMTQEEMPGPLLTQAAERKTKDQPFPVMEPRTRTLDDMRPSGEEPIKAKLSMQPRMTQEAISGPAAERKTKDQPLPVIEPGMRTLDDMRPKPIRAKLSMQPRMTQEAMPGPLLTQAAERMARGHPPPVMAAGPMMMGGMGPNWYGCSYDWMQYGSRCFKLFDTPMTWIDAEKYCSYFGANLASIHHPGEDDLLQEMISWGYYAAWIGGSNAVETSTWLWSDGSIFYYTHWIPGQPDFYDKCITITTEGWLDLNCEDSLPFICGTRPDGPLQLP